MSKLRKYMKGQILKNHLHTSVKAYEEMTGTEIPTEIKKTVINFLEMRIDKHIQDDSLTKSLISMLVVALLKLKIRGVE